MRFATIRTSRGPRLHVRGREGYVDLAEVAPSTPNPPRILCLGVNYADHAIEGGREVPKWPESFVRGMGSVIGPYDDLVAPALTECFDFEAEVAVVIGKGGRYIRAKDAFESILGYSAMNDGSAREWQRKATQWTPGKNFEGTRSEERRVGKEW